VEILAVTNSNGTLAIMIVSAMLAAEASSCQGFPGHKEHCANISGLKYQTLATSEHVCRL